METKITAAQFIDEGYEAKGQAYECVVKSPLYPREIITSIKRIPHNSAGWDVTVTDTRSSYRTYSHVELVVEWLQPAPQPANDGGEAVDVIEYQRSIRNLRDAVIELRSEMHEVACALRYGEITPQAAAERLESALNG